MKTLYFVFMKFFVFLFSTPPGLRNRPRPVSNGLIEGILGKMTQTADNITFSKWKDKNVFKRKRGPRTEDPTASQAANQRKFALLVLLSRVLAPAFKVGLQAYVASQTAYNAFIKNNYPFTSDDGNNASIDYTKIIVAKGSVLALSNFAAAQGSAAKELDLTWDDNSNGTTGLTTDKLFVAVLDTATGSAMYIDAAATRADGAATITVSDFAAATDVEVYPFFTSADGSVNSDNDYATQTTGA